MNPTHYKGQFVDTGMLGSVCNACVLVETSIGALSIGKTISTSLKRECSGNEPAKDKRMQTFLEQNVILDILRTFRFLLMINTTTEAEKTRGV